MQGDFFRLKKEKDGKIRVVNLLEHKKQVIDKILEHKRRTKWEKN